MAIPTSALVRSPLLSALPSPIARNLSDATAQALLSRLDELIASGRSLIISIDEMERLKGMPLALLGFEHLLRTEGDVGATLVQVGVKARNFTPANQQDYEAVRAEMSEIWARIEAVHPGTCIVIELPTISVTQRLQLWRRASVTLFTPVREGLNTYPLEAVWAKREMPPGAPGNACVPRAGGREASSPAAHTRRGGELLPPAVWPRARLFRPT
jgi:trehalose-6-phosphate synthase